MKNFVAIDFETANRMPSSVCSVGIIVVKDGVVVDQFYSLIHPLPDYYDWQCQRVHGLSDEDTKDAPIFPEVWQQICDVFYRNYGVQIECCTIPFVAHNSRFDEGCLKAVMSSYDMSYPNCRFEDTLAASRRTFGRRLSNHQLQTVAAACGYDLRNHHHALADAEACAVIALRILGE